MHRISWTLLCSLLVACGGDDGPAIDGDAAVDVDATVEPDAGLADTATATIGPAGGAIAIDGLTITFAPDALSVATAITVTRTDDAPPGGYQAQSPVFTFLPTGTTFAAPVTVAIDVTGDTAGSALQWTSDGATWDPIAGATANGIFTATIEHFTFGFVGFPLLEAPNGMISWDPVYAFTGAEVFGLIDTGVGIYQVGNYGEIYELSAPNIPLPGPVTMTLASDLAGGGGQFLRGATSNGAGFVASGRIGGALGAATFDTGGALVRAVGIGLTRPDATTVTSEGKGAVVMEDGRVAVVGFQGQTIDVVYLDAGLTTAPVALELSFGYGTSIAPGVGSGAVVGSSYGVFRFDAAGAITWQKRQSGLSGGGFVKIVRLGNRYAVVCNFGSPLQAYVLLLDDTGAVIWQRSLGSTPSSNAMAAGASVIDVGGTPHLWIGGAVGTSAFEWILDSSGTIVDGGGYGAGRAIAAIGSGADLLVAGITSTGLMWASRHSFAYTLPGTCGTSTTTATAAASTLTFEDISPAVVPTVLTPVVTQAVITPIQPASPAQTDACPR